MILKTQTNEEFHPNGQLSYTENVATIEPTSEHLYQNTRHLNGVVWIRVGYCAKFHDNGLMQWEKTYSENGTIISSKNGFRKDGTPIVY
jgi:hypothetical protein